MSNCVLSNQNRFYAKLEGEFGQAPAIAAADRLAAVKLAIRQVEELRERKDKTGSRTFVGVAPGGRKRTQFSLQTYLMAGTIPGTAPAPGALFQAALGGAPLVFPGGSAGAGSTTGEVVFSGPHGLVVGQAFGFAGELRFVTAVGSPTTATVNAPFSTAPAPGAALTGAVTYRPASELPSLSIFDYWDPGWAVNRILIGAAVGQFEIKINADFHEFEFAGEAQDVLDSVSFTAGQGGLASFPAEPALAGLSALPIPGNLGQAWLGVTASKFATITKASITLDNDLDLRAREFGSSVPQCHGAGMRTVLADVSLYEIDDGATRGLYQAARSETPVAVMFQLGQAPGSLFGAYLKSVVPKVPEFDDGERLLEWSFRECRARGTEDDEIYVAFG
jgi:hypothetical protein